MIPLTVHAWTLEDSHNGLVIPSAPIEDVALVAPAKLAFATTSVPVSVEGMVKDAFPDAPIMVAVARAESRFDPSAKNPGSTATGVFQILIGTWKAYNCTGSRINAADNIACARKIYENEGTHPWLSSSANW